MLTTVFLAHYYARVAGASRQVRTCNLAPATPAFTWLWACKPDHHADGWVSHGRHGCCSVEEGVEGTKEMAGEHILIGLFALARGLAHNLLRQFSSFGSSKWKFLKLIFLCVF